MYDLKLKIQEFFKYLKWVLKGKQQIYYSGFHCKICKKWIPKHIYVPTYVSLGREIDAVGICDYCERYNCK